MKERVLNGWTFTRALYLVTGSAVIIQSAMRHQWFGVVIGGYFAAMGLFAFGCASGNCFGGKCEVEAKQKSNISFQDVDCKKNRIEESINNKNNIYENIHYHSCRNYYVEQLQQ